MDEINQLLQDAGLSALKECGFSIVSLFGNPGFPSTSTFSNGKPMNVATTLANRIVDQDVFVPAGQSLKEGTTEIIKGLQLHVDVNIKIAYLFIDATLSTTTLAEMYRQAGSSEKKSMQSIIQEHRSKMMRCLLLMCLVSHLVIPILPPNLLTSDFLSTLVILSQVKHGIYTHLAQFQSACWKCWDIAVPSSLFERSQSEGRRDRDRVSSNLMGWWGPAKGVPFMTFIAAETPINNVESTNRANLPIIIKRLQETMQSKVKYIFRASHLAPLADSAGHEPIEVRSLFTLPPTAQPFIHVVPATPYATTWTYTEHLNYEPSFTFGKVVSVSSWLKENDNSRYAKRKEPSKQEQMANMLDDFGNKLLRNFVAHWVKAATTRHPMHLQVATATSRKSSHEAKQGAAAPLPTALQFASALVSLRALIFPDSTESNPEFKKTIISELPGAKGMIQQIEVVLRKKIRDTVEIERVFSRSHSLETMRKCIEAYLQESPPWYTQQYHLWKRNNALLLYNSLARGPCAEEFAQRLEKECDLIWKQERQSCEQISLTGKVCRLKMGHENHTSSDTSSQNSREDRALADNSKHNSGCSFFHACTCGKTQKLREDPFDVHDANIGFYERFSCCLSHGHTAINLQTCKWEKDGQILERDTEKIPPFDAALLYLGPATSYRNTVGLDKYEGFMSNTNYLLPWTLAINTDTTEESDSTKRSQPSESAPLVNKKEVDDMSSWPLPGKSTEKSPKKPIILERPALTNSMEAFPALGSTRTQTTSTPTSTVSQTKSSEEPPYNRRERRRREGKRREREQRLEGLVRGYVGVEYECPLGHRFLSCGDGKICKIGHKSHPKEHANYFVGQDVPLYVLCPCNFAKNQGKTNTDITAQLQRCYIVAPDAPVAIAIKPSIKIHIPGTDETIKVTMGLDNELVLPPNGFYVFRLPYIYCDSTGKPIPYEPDVEKRLKQSVLEKNCFRVHTPSTDRQSADGR